MYLWLWMLVALAVIIAQIGDLQAERRCARCRQLLQKHKPDSEVKCPVCGWIWK